jgi:catechol-2,3-dioxygenase
MDVPMRVPEANDIVSPAKFAHIVLYTKQFETLVDWYVSFLGAQITGAGMGLAFLTYDDEHHRVAIIEKPDYNDPVPNTVGLAHFAFCYASLGDLIAHYERMKEKGVLPVRTINHGPTTSMYYLDPDGNAVEVQVDNFPNNEALNAWFDKGVFDKNPIGVHFDFEDLIRRYRAGEAEADLLFPIEDGEMAPLLDQVTSSS